MKRQILTEAKDRSRLNNECYKDIHDLIFIFSMQCFEITQFGRKDF